jgi:hypothetical protein
MDGSVVTGELTTTGYRVIKNKYPSQSLDVTSDESSEQQLT